MTDRLMIAFIALLFIAAIASLAGMTLCGTGVYCL